MGVVNLGRVECLRLWISGAKKHTVYIYGPVNKLPPCGSKSLQCLTPGRQEV